MGDDLSYAMFLIHQGQARDLSQQHKLQQVFLRAKSMRLGCGVSILR